MVLVCSQHFVMITLLAAKMSKFLGVDIFFEKLTHKSILGNNTEAQEFLGRGGQVIIRMRGLPYDCSAKQVVSRINIIGIITSSRLLFQIEFFNNGEEACDVLDQEGGVLFVKKPDGRATGDAFVLFKEETEGEKALLKHKEIIGSRYIELFRSEKYLNVI